MKTSNQTVMHTNFEFRLPPEGTQKKLFRKMNLGDVVKSRDGKTTYKVSFGGALIRDEPRLRMKKKHRLALNGGGKWAFSN